MPPTPDDNLYVVAESRTTVASVKTLLKGQRQLFDTLGTLMNSQTTLHWQSLESLKQFELMQRQWKGVHDQLAASREAQRQLQLYGLAMLFLMGLFLTFLMFGYSSLRRSMGPREPLRLRVSKGRV